MKYTYFRSKNFRNLKEFEFNPHPRVNIFLGLNGQGKTNLIEAFYLASQGETFRFGEMTDLVQHQSSQALIQLKMEKNELEDRIHFQIDQGKKNIFLNGKKTSSQKVQEKYNCVVFSPESLQSIKEGSEQRRILIDDLIKSIYPQRNQQIHDFKRLLKTRNKVLKEIKEEKFPRDQLLEVLESLQPQFFKAALEYTTIRLRMIHEIQQTFNHSMEQISARGKSVEIKSATLSYSISGENATHWTAEEVMDALKKRHQELHIAEMASGLSLYGPQRHDLQFLYDGKDSRIFCSQGQQRALILAFKMAQIVYHYKVRESYPILMLDDVLSELDQEKRQALITFLHSIQAQTFITSTDLYLSEDFPDLNLSVFTVNRGSIVRQKNDSKRQFKINQSEIKQG
ncbi:MAG: DNA replication/repair protein RecF [Pseudobdellovibrionaceae bacterium]